jgi:hypothetical protein
LLHALDAELGAGPRPEGVGIPLDAARAALDAGDIQSALRSARAAVDEVVAAADWLERATDDDPVERRHSMRLLRELDRELLGESSLAAVLALAADTDPVRAQLARALAAIEAALLAREAEPETGPVAHRGLRIARLRALVRLLDGVRATDDADLEPRLAALRRLMARAAADRSPLRRAVWAAMTRVGDALLRDGHAEFSISLRVDDLVLGRTSRSCAGAMVPDVETAFDAYGRLERAAGANASPDDANAARAVVERIADLADALPPEQSPRVESVRLALARLGNKLARVAAADSVPDGALDGIATELGALAACSARGDSASRRRLSAQSSSRCVASGLVTEQAAPFDTRAVDAAITACRATPPDRRPPARPGLAGAPPARRSDRTVTAAINDLPAWIRCRG